MTSLTNGGVVVCSKDTASKLNGDSYIGDERERERERQRKLSKYNNNIENATGGHALYFAACSMWWPWVTCAFVYRNISTHKSQTLTAQK